MTAEPIWLSVPMVIYCIWVIIVNVKSGHHKMIYGALPTLGVYLVMRLCSWYPTVLSIFVLAAAGATFVYHYIED